MHDLSLSRLDTCLYTLEVSIQSAAAPDAISTRLLRTGIPLLGYVRGDSVSRFVWSPKYYASDRYIIPPGAGAADSSSSSSSKQAAAAAAAAGAAAARRKNALILLRAATYSNPIDVYVTRLHKHDSYIHQTAKPQDDNLPTGVYKLQPYADDPNTLFLRIGRLRPRV